MNKYQLRLAKKYIESLGFKIMQYDPQALILRGYLDNTSFKTVTFLYINNLAHARSCFGKPEEHIFTHYKIEKAAELKILFEHNALFQKDFMSQNLLKDDIVHT